MKNAIGILSACAGLVCLSVPANAVVMVVGNQLGHECYIAAKLAVDPMGGIKTCTMALENEAMSRHDRAATVDNRGTLHHAMKNYQRALSDYDLSLELEADLADAYVNRAGTYIMLQRYDDAMADATKGISLGTSVSFVGYYNRAVAEQLTGKMKEAYFDYKKALELEPRFTPASDRLKDFTVTTVPAAKP